MQYGEWKEDTVDARQTKIFLLGATRDGRVRSYLASYKPDSVYFKEVFASQSASLDANSLLLDSILVKSAPDYLQKPALRIFR